MGSAERNRGADLERLGDRMHKRDGGKPRSQIFREDEKAYLVGQKKLPTFENS